MPYDNPGSETMHEGPHSDPGMAGDRETMNDGQEIIHIEPDMLPEESRKDLKVGDILEFKVVNPSENGLIAVAYNMPKKTGQSPQREGADEMMGDFKDYMSAREGGEGGAGEMSQPAGGGY